MISVVPLVFFAAAALRLPLTTLGFVQYLAPSCALLLAVFLYNEPVLQVRWVTFDLSGPRSPFLLRKMFTTCASD